MIRPDIASFFTCNSFRLGMMPMKAVSDKQENAGSNKTSLAPGEFAVKDCALIAIATGEKVINLKEFRHTLAEINPDSIYFHFWGSLLQPRFEEREFNNDFASWARHGLHDHILAERLAVIDPTSFATLEELRDKILEIVEDRLDESEYLRWASGNKQFEFIRTQIVVFDTHTKIKSPEELSESLPKISTSSIFYHFIDARRRTPGGTDDFRFWLSGCGKRYDPLCVELAGVDPYFGSLAELRDKLAAIFQNFFAKVPQ